MNTLLRLMPARKAGQLESWSDEQLMQAYQEGRAEAFDVLYGRHRASLYRFLIRLSGRQDEWLNELFQDIWLKLINARDRYQATAKFTTYLYRIAHNHLVDYWRSHKDFTELQHDTVDNAETPDLQLEQEQQQQRLKHSISRLPEEQRTAFLLQKEAQLSLEQIADVTGVNRETVKSRLRYAMKRLRETVLDNP